MNMNDTSEKSQNLARRLVVPKAMGLTSLTGMIVVSALILFACSSLRHALFQSAAFDLGIFDQAIYLISQGEPPISSFTNHHIMGDHAAWIFYL